MIINKKAYRTIVSTFLIIVFVINGCAGQHEQEMASKELEPQMTLNDPLLQDHSLTSDGSCASHTDCQNCTDHLTCHWCADDNACHTIGSPFGCTIGLSCPSALCVRSEAEFIGYQTPPTLSIFYLISLASLAFTGSVLGSILLYYLIDKFNCCYGISCVYKCLTCCCGSNKNGNSSDNESSLNTDNSSHSNINRALAPLLLTSMNNNTVALSSSTIKIQSSNHNLLKNNNKNTRMEKEKEQKQLVVSVGPSSGPLVLLKGKNKNDSLSLCLRIMKWFIIVVGLTIGIIFLISFLLFPQLPSYSMCNTNIQWGSILKSLSLSNPGLRANVDVTFSFYNPNRFSVKMDEAYAHFYYKNEMVAFGNLTSLYLHQGSIQDFVMMAQFSPSASTLSNMLIAHLSGNLVLNVLMEMNAEIFVLGSELLNVKTNYTYNNLDVESAPDRTLCKCN